jgi:hypothetical protein
MAQAADATMSGCCKWRRLPVRGTLFGMSAFDDGRDPSDGLPVVLDTTWSTEWLRCCHPDCRRPRVPHEAHGFCKVCSARMAARVRREAHGRVAEGALSSRVSAPVGGDAPRGAAGVLEAVAQHEPRADPERAPSAVGAAVRRVPRCPGPRAAPSLPALRGQLPRASRGPPTGRRRANAPGAPGGDGAGGLS